MNIVLAYPADQKSLNAYGKKKRISTRNTALHSLVVANKGADCFVQIFDLTAASDGAADTAADILVGTGQVDFELPVQGGSFLPFSFPGGWKFGNGCYVRCVTQADGLTANVIATSDCKFTASFMDGPLLG